jgi:hypothetical protein
MKAAEQLHHMGQSLWLDNITRWLLISGTLERYIRELSIGRLTSNPNIFEHAIRDTGFYDEATCAKMQAGQSGEKLFFELALEDLTKAADPFGPVLAATNCVDGDEARYQTCFSLLLDNCEYNHTWLQKQGEACVESHSCSFGPISAAWPSARTTS